MGEISGNTIPDRWLFLGVLAVVFPIYLVTANTAPPYNMDTLTNVLSAETIGRTGSPIMTDRAELAEQPFSRVLTWVVDSPRGPVSKYPPGTALLAAIPYSLTGPGEVADLSLLNDPDDPSVSVAIPPLWPAAVVSSLVSALAVALTALSVRRLTTAWWAILAAAVLAFGTGLWLNGAHRLWQHGVASLWIALGMWLSGKGRWLASGLALGLGVLTRPPVAFIALGLGTLGGLRDRTWRPVVLHGLGAAVGLAALLAYNAWLWTDAPVTGGYGSAYDGRLADPDLTWFLRNVTGGLVSADRGLFVWSPVVLIAGVGIRDTWRQLPGWTLGGLVGGALMLLVQWRLNRYSGGEGFLSYRYPIEMLVAATPALAVAAHRVRERSRLLGHALVGAAVVSVVMHTVGIVAELTY